MSDIKFWSTAAASNNASVPNGFPEGMAPSGVNDSAREQMAATRRWYEDAQWTDLGHTPTYVSASTFTLVGDKKATYEVGRRIRAQNGSSTLYGTITSSTYTAATGIYATLDTGSFTASLTAVAVSILTSSNNSIPALGNINISTLTSSTIVSLSVVKTDTISERSDTAGVTIDGLLIKNGGISDGTNIVKTKIIDIGDWNMNFSGGGAASVGVAHGLTFSKIRSVSAVVRDDADVNYYLLTPGWINTPVEVDGYISSFNTTNIVLNSTSSGKFDSTDFNATAYNRGWVTIIYID